MRRTCLLLGLLAWACSSPTTAPSTPEPPPPVTATLTLIGDSLTVTKQADGSYAVAGQVQNSGTGCATEVHGMLRIERDGTPIAHLPATLPMRIAPGETVAVQACCLAPATTGDLLAYQELQFLVERCS